jgi:hypothetical protein
MTNHLIKLTFSQLDLTPEVWLALKIRLFFSCLFFSILRYPTNELSCSPTRRRCWLVDGFLTYLKSYYEALTEWKQFHQIVSLSAGWQLFVGRGCSFKYLKLTQFIHPLTSFFSASVKNPAGH